MTQTLRDRIADAVVAAGAHDPNVEVGPVAILWTDEQRQWERLIPALRDRLAVVEYGLFAEEERRGPAYWLRCAIAGTIEPSDLPNGPTVVYLPGVSRDMLRSHDTQHGDLLALGGLVHRCRWFSHPNHKDWTIRSLLTNTERGLGLSVDGGAATADALVACIAALAGKPMAQLESTHIDDDFLNEMISPDPTRAVLEWLNDPAAFRNGVDDAAWTAFAQQLKQKFGADVTEGELSAAQKLGEANGNWLQVWQRFREMPAAWPGVVDRLRKARPAELLPLRPEAWPGVAEEEEDKLRSVLTEVADLPPTEARSTLLELETTHKARRGHVWAELGMTPLALALEHLAEVARRTATNASAGTVEELRAWYAEEGWRADRAAVLALTEVTSTDDKETVGRAVNAVYKPWLHAAAVALQTAIGPNANADTYRAEPVPTPNAGQVVVFVDGLRLDVAHALVDRLAAGGHDAAIEAHLAALPTVTDTAKPAVAPVDQNRLVGGHKLELRRTPIDRKYDIEVLRELLVDSGLQVLKGIETGDPSGTAWTDVGDLDKRGHDFGTTLVHEIDDEVRKIAERVDALVRAGWQTVTVVTDHGWLLLHGGLDKNSLVKQAAVEIRKGRCARLKDGAESPVPTVPWHWDHHVRIAVANGITCFTDGQEYEHGGVSPQECFVPRVTVTARQAARSAASVEIGSMKWKGIALWLEFVELPDGATIDLRMVAGDPSTSIVGPEQLTQSGLKRVLFADEDREDDGVVLVVVGADGSLLLQLDTTVGQNR